MRHQHASGQRGGRTGYALLALDVLLLALFVLPVAVAVAWIRRPVARRRGMKRR